MPDSQPLFQTAWTQIEILPAQTETLTHRRKIHRKRSAIIFPASSGSGDAHLHLLPDYLYSSTDTVRRYTSLALGYWSEDEINR
jgi:hypothetical protein